ncbi:MAG TPA: YjhG/YagF family D-xylonate dehydratase [Terriglobales bacterium]|nr:YjhG/YagF family D-xylonate dehydratase [Terriglobales bacterium]
MKNPFDSDNAELLDVRSRAVGPTGSLPLTPEMLVKQPSGNLFGWSQNAGMGWKASELGGKEFLMLSTHGGIRDRDGTPIALGYHTGHWEIGLLLEAAARVFKAAGAIPFAAACSDPCDGRSQGTTAMFDSLPYRNDAATVFRRLIRSLPTRRGVLGVATCDKGLPAMMMALAGSGKLPCVLVPGGVTLMPEQGEDAGRSQTIGARFAHGLISVAEASEIGCRACATPGGGCQFLGTAATSQVVGEALGLSIGHSALAPSGHPIWTDMARRSARALMDLETRGISVSDILSDAAIENALVVHAAFGGSTNLILHLPAIAHAAGLKRPTAADWAHVNRRVPRLVDVLPNGPRNHPTVQVFQAGAVPEVMLHLRRAGLLNTSVLTADGMSLDERLNAWEESERRKVLRARLTEKDGVNPDDVILIPDAAKQRGMTSTVCFPHGNLAPEGSVIKSTAIDPTVVGSDGVYRITGPAKVFLSEPDAIAAIKSGKISAGDVIVLAGRGPMGSGMEETFQLTGALRYLPFGKNVALITDARFSGVSTGACIGHISPEALAGGPIGRLRDGDVIEIAINRQTLEGSVNLVGESGTAVNIEQGDRILSERRPRPDLAPDPSLPNDTRIWAALQDVSGGPWGGAVYDPEAILEVIEAGKRVLGTGRQPSDLSRQEEPDRHRAQTLQLDPKAIPPEQAH